MMFRVQWNLCLKHSNKCSTKLHLTNFVFNQSDKSFKPFHNNQVSKKYPKMMSEEVEKHWILDSQCICLLDPNMDLTENLRNVWVAVQPDVKANLEKCVYKISLGTLLLWLHDKHVKVNYIKVWPENEIAYKNMQPCEKNNSICPIDGSTDEWLVDTQIDFLFVLVQY